MTDEDDDLLATLPLTPWMCALHWGDLLVAWHASVHSEAWPADPGNGPKQVAVVYARAVLAVAMKTGLPVPASLDPHDFDELRLAAVVRAVTGEKNFRTLLDPGLTALLGPSSGELGFDVHNEVIWDIAARGGEVRDQLAARCRTVGMAHLADEDYRDTATLRNRFRAHLRLLDPNKAAYWDALDDVLGGPDDY